jgi:hypothetical protein
MAQLNRGIILISALLLPLVLISQDKAPKMKYGNISEQEMKMTSYPGDPGAPALVLFDKGSVRHSYFEGTGFILEYEHHKRVKIFKKDAYDFADIAVFYSKGQKLTEFKACCYNQEGDKIVETKLSSDNIFEEKLTSRYFVKKGAIPGVREGSVIEIKYTLQDDGVGLPVSEWVFQNSRAPTVWSEFEASVPTFIEYKKFAQGWTPYALAKEEEKNERILRDVNYAVKILHYIQKDVPALNPEPYVASNRDYLSKITFDVNGVYKISLVSNGASNRLDLGIYEARNDSWSQLGKDLLEEDYKDVLSSTKFTGSETARCIEGKKTSLEKAASVYEYIGKNYEATDYDYFWKSQTLDHLTKNKKGTPTDLNILMINMLRRADLNAFPVLTSTLGNGKPVSFRVSLRQFDRVLTGVILDDGTITLIDASAWPNPIGLLPKSDCNGAGLMLKDQENIEWIPLQSKIADRSALLSEISLTPEGLVRGKISFSETGHAAVAGREMIRKKDVQTFVKEHYKEMVAGGQLTEVSTEANPDWNTPGLKGSFLLESASYATVSGNKIYLNPMLNMGLTETPFKNPDRKFGVDFGPPVVSNYVFSFTIPSGYQVEEAPKSMKLVFDEQALSFDYIVDRSNPDLIKITVKRSIKTPFVSVEKFPDLQQFYSTMVAKMAEQIVLTK